MRKINQDNSRHRATLRRRKGSSYGRQFYDAAVRAVTHVNAERIRVMEVMAQGPQYRAFASRLANAFGWTAKLRLAVGLPAKSRPARRTA